MRVSHVIVIGVLLSCFAAGCRQLNQALPEFLRKDPGSEEMEIYAEVKRTREWTVEDEGAQARELAAIDGLRAEQRFSEAADRLDQFLATWPGSRYDERAHYLLGKSWYEADEFGDSYKAFKTFTRNYLVSDYFPEVMEMEYQMGKEYLAGNRATFLGIFKHRGVGIDILEGIVERFPTGSRAADAQWTVASYQLDDEDWPAAAAGFSFIIDHYKESEWYAPSLFYHGYAQYRQVKGVVYDPEIMRLTELAFERYIREVPAGPWVGEARQIRDEMIEMQAGHIYEIGRWYHSTGHPYAARYYLVKVSTIHPTTEAAARARKLLEEIVPEDVPRAAPEVAPEPAAGSGR